MGRRDSREERGGGRLRLTLLGRVDLSDGGGRRIQSVLSQPKRVAVLAYLAIAGRDRFVRRDELTAVFWPRRNDERARKALRDALYFLRRSLGEEVILTPGDEVGLDWGRLECDVVELLEAVEAGDGGRAKEVYRGELLPAFHVSGAVGFEHWVDETRLRLDKLAAAVGVSAAELSDSGQRTVGRTHPPYKKPLLRWVKPLLAAALIVLVLWGISATWSGGGERPGPDLILVTEFENLTGDSALDFLGTYATQVLFQGLLDAGLVPAANPERVGQLLPGAATQEGGGDPQRRLELSTALARNLGASLAILGTLWKAPNGAELWADVVEVASGEIVEALGPFSWDSLASETSLLELRSRVLGSVASRTTSEVAPLPKLERRPPRYEAFREYVVGRRAHRRSGFAEELAAYRRAIAIDPEFMHPRVMMMVAYGNLAMTADLIDGPEAMQEPLGRGRELAEALLPDRDRMAPAQRHWFDYQRASLLGSHLAAVTAARRLVSVLPTDYSRFVLGLSANKARRFQEAADALSQINPDEGELREWPYFWHNANWALHQIGRHREELSIAQEGYLRYPDGQQFLFGEFAALVALERPDDAINVFATGGGISDWPSFGPRRPGGMFLLAARELRTHGFGAEAEAIFEQALEWHEEQPDSLRQLERFRFERAETLYELDRFSPAGDILRALVAQSNDRVHYQGHLGVVAARLGDGVLVQQQEAWLATSGGNRPYGASRLWRARIAAVAGDARQAVRLLEEAYREGAQLTPVVPFDYDLHTGRDWDPIRDDPVFQRLLETRE